MKEECADSLYELVGDLLRRSVGPRSVVIDVGCGQGFSAPLGRFPSALHWHRCRILPDFPAECEFVEADLNAPWPLSSNYADAVVSIETIDHLENPRAFVREIARVAKPGGLVAFSTPNQLSLLSKLCLLIRNEFVYFQERPGLYPAHITASAEKRHLCRIALECGLSEGVPVYSLRGRIPFTRRRHPRFFSERFRGPFRTTYCWSLASLSQRLAKQARLASRPSHRFDRWLRPRRPSPPVSCAAISMTGSSSPDLLTRRSLAASAGTRPAA